MENKVQHLRRKVEVRLAALGKTRTWLGEKMGVSPQAVTQFLDKAWPNTQALAKASTALGLPLVIFFEPGLPSALLDNLPPDALEEAGISEAEE